LEPAQPAAVPPSPPPASPLDPLLLLLVLLELLLLAPPLLLLLVLLAPLLLAPPSSWAEPPAPLSLDEEHAAAATIPTAQKRAFRMGALQARSCVNCPSNRL
jgi:hypothetical protein